jgi:Zn-dependent M28 family amino/carboxypeptidase
MALRHTLTAGLVLALVACQDGGTVPGGAIPAARRQVAAHLGSQASASDLRSHVETLYAVHLSDAASIPVWAGQAGPGPLSRLGSARHVAATFERLGLSAVTETESSGGLETRNVYADIPGSTRPEEQIVLSAHHDTWFGGADDNGSGVAVLFEAARILRHSAPARTIRLLACDQEEQGQAGAVRYVRAHARDRIVAIVNLDAIGFANDTPGSQQSPPGLSLPDRADFLAAIVDSRSEGLLAEFLRLNALVPDGAKTVGNLAPGDARYPFTADFLRSDHSPFWAHGVPGIFFTDTTNFRSPHFHKAGDTPDTLDYGFLHRAAKSIIALTAALAEVK